MRMVPRFFGSMAGRMFVISLVGAIASAMLALGMAGMKREADRRHSKLEQIAERVQNYVDLLNHASPAASVQLIREGVPKLRPAAPGARGDRVDPVLTQMLRERLGPESGAVVEPMNAKHCVRKPSLPYQTPFDSMYEREASCWLVRFTLNEAPLRLYYLEQNVSDGGPLAWDPLFFVVLALGVAVAALIAARVAAAPLHRLSQAASTLAGNLDQSPLPERGPHEVRSAASAFNAMQTVLKRHIKERHQMLAAITHDLQTPLTRIRLRVEKIENEDVRERLIADLGAMQQLIQEGLELVRGAEASEAPIRIDLDSLLDCLAVDAVDSGDQVRIASGCGCIIFARPRSLTRALNNLVQNAVRYAGAAEIQPVFDGDRLTIAVRDAGPGIPEHQLEAVLEPFVRLDSSRSRDTGGVGLGLTIARRLVERDGGVLALANRPGGGLEATITFPRSQVVSVRARVGLPKAVASVP